MNRSITSPIQLDRAAGVLVGGAVGDALGAGYEFAGAPAPEDVTMLRGRLTGGPPGHWTDDTEMALCIAQVAARGVPLDGPPGLHEVGQRFLDWFAADPADVGIQTRSVLSGARGPADLAASAAAYARDHERSAGNGSLMRTGPVALAHLGDGARLQAAASAISALTHDDPLACDACVLWCCAIDQAVRSGRLDGPRCGLVHLPDDRRAFWAGIIEEAETTDPGTFRPNGFVATALQAAWAAIHSTKSSTGRRHIDMALRAAVAIGDDTDTVASIAGALLGARWGAAAVPFAWRRRLGGWPGLAHADLVTLGVLIAQGGVPDKNGWPGVADLMPMYREELSPRGKVVTLAADPGVVWGDVAGLADAEADAFISLCRIGASQRRGPEHHEVWLVDSDSDDANADLDLLLADTADAIAQLRSEGRRVFVHCAMCESRTPTVAMAWLVRHHRLTLGQAESAVRSAMLSVRPKAALREALQSMPTSELPIENPGRAEA